MTDSRDYEVDLQECFKVIAKRKIVILAVFFCFGYCRNYPQFHPTQKIRSLNDH